MCSHLLFMSICKCMTVCAVKYAFLKLMPSGHSKSLSVRQKIKCMYTKENCI